MKRFLALIVLLAGAGLPGHAAVPGSRHMSTVTIGSNAWVAWKVNVPTGAQSSSYSVEFIGDQSSGRLAFDTWVLRAPYTGPAEQGSHYGVSYAWQLHARVQPDRSISQGVHVNGGSVLGAIAENDVSGGNDLALGENIIVAVVAAGNGDVRGSLSLWMPKTNGPPPVLIESAWGSEAFFHTEYDFHSDEPYVRASLPGGVHAAYMHNVWLHQQIGGRYFGRASLRPSGSSYTGPSGEDACGSGCWRFNGTASGLYRFDVASNQALGPFAGEMQVFGADVDLTLLL